MKIREQRKVVPFLRSCHIIWQQSTHSVGLCLWVGISEITVDHSSTKKVVSYLEKQENGKARISYLHKATQNELFV